jgi:hypothetical protein
VLCGDVVDCIPNCPLGTESFVNLLLDVRCLQQPKYLISPYYNHWKCLWKRAYVNECKPDFQLTSTMPFLNPNLKSAILLCCAKALRGLTDFRAKPFIFEPHTNFPVVARTLLFISPQKPFPHLLETIFLSPHLR